MDFWGALTEAQATIIAALLTMIGAAIGVLLGWWLFSAKVKTLTDALDAARERLTRHEVDVDEKLTAINAKYQTLLEQSGRLPESFGVLNDQLAALIQSVTQVEGAVADQREQAEASEDYTSWHEVRDSWARIRDRLDQVAADPKIDGRTRAKYARIDRRNYGWLIDSLESDGNLKKVQKFNVALDLWHQHRNGKRKPSAATVKEMAALADELAPIGNAA